MGHGAPLALKFEIHPDGHAHGILIADPTLLIAQRDRAAVDACLIEVLRSIAFFPPPATRTPITYYLDLFP